MLKKIGLLIMVVLLSGLLVSSVAAGPSVFSSSFQVQNLNDSVDANISISYYNRDGTTADLIADVILAGSSNTYFPVHADVGFDGSVIISADVEIAAISNLHADSMAYSASYTAFDEGGEEAYLPLLMFDNYGFNTWLNVQNVGADPVDITVEYSDGLSATVTGVAPGAAAYFDQTTEGHVSGWVGSATVSTSAGVDGLIAATAIETGDLTLFAYDGFTAGSTNPIMPIYQANNWDYSASIQIQNLGTTSTDVTIEYTPGAGMPGTSCLETQTVPAGEMTTFGLYVHTYPDITIDTTCIPNESFVGSAAVITNTEGNSLVSIVNQLNFLAAQNKGAAYNAFDPAQASSKVVLPLWFDRNWGYWTGTNLLNIGVDLQAGEVVCTATSSNDHINSPVNLTSPALPSGAAWTIQNRGDLNSPLGDTWVGSAVCEGPVGSQLIGVVNELGGPAGDTLLVYEGINN